jgi:hypothetical protein
MQSHEVGRLLVARLHLRPPRPTARGTRMRVRHSRPARMSGIGSRRQTATLRGPSHHGLPALGPRAEPVGHVWEHPRARPAQVSGVRRCIRTARPFAALRVNSASRTWRPGSGSLALAVRTTAGSAPRAVPSSSLGAAPREARPSWPPQDVTNGREDRRAPPARRVRPFPERAVRSCMSTSTSRARA